MKRIAPSLFLVAALAFAHPPVIPRQTAKPVGPYSPGMDTADFLYLSGQGVRDAESKMPTGVTDQARRCLTNIKDILEAGGLTLGHVVSVQLYLADLAMLPEVEKVYNEFFPQSAPARVVVGTVRMPTGTPIEMTAVAVKDISKKRVAPEGVWAGSRLYLNGIAAPSVAEARGLLNAALHKAGLSARALVFLNTYTTGKAAGAEVPVLALPGGAIVALSAIASTSAGKPAEDGCREDANTLYCEARPASASGSIADQTREAFMSVKARLESHGFHLGDIAATNVWLNDLEEFQAMNAVYASFFTDAFPTRTTIQPASTQPGAPGIRLSVVAVR
jgi:2-iminobutanoate/2-iminopropanoate deaminase